MANQSQIARDVMTPNPRTVTPETPVREAARLMQTEDTGVLPVVRGGDSKQVLGVLTDRDLAIRVVAEGRSDARVSDAMTQGARTARADDDLERVLDLMSREQIRRVPIVDERGELVGIVSQADVVLQGDGKRAEAAVEAISQPGR